MSRSALRLLPFAHPGDEKTLVALGDAADQRHRNAFTAMDAQSTAQTDMTMNGVISAVPWYQAEVSA